MTFAVSWSRSAVLASPTTSIEIGRSCGIHPAPTPSASACAPTSGGSKVSGRIDALSGRIDGLQGEMNARFAAVDVRFSALEHRIDNLDRDVSALIKRALDS